MMQRYAKLKGCTAVWAVYCSVDGLVSIVVRMFPSFVPVFKVIPKILSSLNWGSVRGGAKMHLRVRALPKASKSGLDSNTCFSTLRKMLQRLTETCIDCR